MTQTQSLKKSLSQGETKQVLVELLNTTTPNTDLHHQAIQLSARFAEYEKKQLGNLEDPGILGIELNKITQTALAIIEKLETNNILEAPTNPHYIEHSKTNNTMKNLLILIAFILLAFSIYFFYDWYKSEPQNKESLPTLLSGISTIIMFIVAWRYGESGNAKVWRLLSYNKSTIKGSGNDVEQGNQGDSTIGVSKTSIEGNENEVKQENGGSPTIDFNKASIIGDKNKVKQGKTK